ncbi:MAG: NAD(P)/FAD-dependent oxidoreductase [Asticcacaulis sp.]
MQTQVIIIGGGPAGIACAIWLKKLGVAAVLLEASDRLGGLQTLSPYENLWIPGVQGLTGQQVAASLAEHAETEAIDIRLNCLVLSVTAKGHKVTTSQGDFAATCLVIATGTRPRSAGFQATDRVAIGPGLPMEALDVADKRVAILGGGDNAFDQARFVRDRGGDPVIFTRTPPRAQKLLQEAIPDVPVVVGHFKADQQSMMVNDEAFDVFGIMYGFEAVVPSGIAPDMTDGYVRVDRDGLTSISNIYACGEVTNYWHPCVATACAHGIQVAKQISRCL